MKDSLLAADLILPATLFHLSSDLCLSLQIALSAVFLSFPSSLWFCFGVEKVFLKNQNAESFDIFLKDLFLTKFPVGKFGFNPNS
jgi:hypothetical protein